MELSKCTNTKHEKEFEQFLINTRKSLIEEYSEIDCKPNNVLTRGNLLKMIKQVDDMIK